MSARQCSLPRLTSLQVSAAFLITGVAAPRPEKRLKMEVDLEPAPFTKRVSHPPYARGGYNSEEWVFDDEDDDDMPAEQYDYGEQDEPRHHAAGDQDDGIRSLEVTLFTFDLIHVHIVRIVPHMNASTLE